MQLVTAIHWQSKAFHKSQGLLREVTWRTVTTNHHAACPCQLFCTMCSLCNSASGHTPSKNGLWCSKLSVFEAARTPQGQVLQSSWPPFQTRPDILPIRWYIKGCSSSPWRSSHECQRHKAWPRELGTLLCKQSIVNTGILCLPLDPQQKNIIILYNLYHIIHIISYIM